MKELYAVGFIVIALSCSTAQAQSIPRFSIEASCRQARSLTPEDRNPYEGCVRDETSARTDLTALWVTSSREHREACVEEAKLGESPSYVELLVCLQMYGGTTSIDPKSRRLRTKS